MSSTTLDQSTHPILGFARALDGALDRVSAVSPVFMSADDKRAALLALTRERHRLEALWLRVIAAADLDDIGAIDGSTSTGAWLSHHTQTAQGKSPHRRSDGHRASPAGSVKVGVAAKRRAIKAERRRRHGRPQRLPVRHGADEPPMPSRPAPAPKIPTTSPPPSSGSPGSICSRWSPPTWQMS